MPRNGLATRVLPKLGQLPASLAGPKPFNKAGPKLYNAKTQIKTSQSAQSKGNPGKLALQRLDADPLDTSWRRYVSEDVTQFVDDMEAQGTKLLPEEIRHIAHAPAHYFSRPQHVPNNLRAQVYFPDFPITLVRSTVLGPYYATFQVPLWFSKLDLKGYLKEVYNVDLVHIRSSVTQPDLVRGKPRRMYQKEPRIRPMARKRMIVQLVEPFEWPVKTKDIDRTPFMEDRYKKTVKAQKEDSVMQNDWFKQELDRKHRKSVAEQAKAILEGKAKWTPTWQQMPDARRMFDTSTLPPPEQQASLGQPAGRP